MVILSALFSFMSSTKYLKYLNIYIEISNPINPNLLTTCNNIEETDAMSSVNLIIFK